MNDKNSLKHYGVPGMRWGVRRRSFNHPLINMLSRRKKKDSVNGKNNSKEDIKTNSKLREKILSNPKLLYKFRKEFTDDEIKKAIAKFKMEKELSGLSGEQSSKAHKQIKNLIGYGKTASEAYALYNSDLGKLLRKQIGGKVARGR